MRLSAPAYIWQGPTNTARLICNSVSGWNMKTLNFSLDCCFFLYMTFQEKTLLARQEVPNKKAKAQTKNPYGVVLLWWVNPFWLTPIFSAGEGEEIWWTHFVGCGWGRLMVHPLQQSLSWTKQIQFEKISLAYCPSWSSASSSLLQHGSFPWSPVLQEWSAPVWLLHEGHRSSTNPAPAWAPL